MADKMLRIAGRGDDGTAKAVRTNDNGEQLVQLTGSKVKKLTLFQSKDTTGNAVIEIENAQTLIIETYGPANGLNVKFHARGDGNFNRPLMGVRVSDFHTATETTSTSELWRFDVEGLYRVIIEIVAINAGSNFYVLGRLKY